MEPRALRLGVAFPLFVCVGFGVSWSLWLAAGLISADATAAGALDALATFGPATAALVLTRWGRQGSAARVAPRQRTSAATRIVLSSAVLAGSVLVLLPRWSPDISARAAALLAVLAVPPAALVWLSMGDDAGWRALLGGLTRPRSAWWTFVVAVLAFPALSAAGTGLVAVLGGDVGAAPEIVRQGAGGVVVVFVATLLYGGPLGEEVGWRGWAVPALQTRFSPLLTSLFVGLLWGLWHLPLHVRGVYDDAMGSGIPGMALRLASSCLLAVVFTWLYNRSRGGLLVVVLLHTSVNNTAGYWLPVNIGLTAVLLVVAGVLVVTDRMWERTRTPHADGRHPSRR